MLKGQELILGAGFVESGQSWLLEMPTGSGKTWLAGQAIEYVLRQGRRAVYVAPTKALTQHQYTNWSYEFGADSVGIMDSDHELTAEQIADIRLLVSTPESLESCLRSPQAHLSWIRQLSVLVIDEIDLINDEWRGARLEGAIIQLQLLNPLLRVVGITATLGDARALRSWLGAAFVRTTQRPVPLHWQQIRFWTGAEKQERTVAYLCRAVEQGHQCVLFCQGRAKTEALSTALQQRGVLALCHHAGLDNAARSEAETTFQSGKTQVLCATATLAVGVNLPAREVIIYDTQRSDGNGNFVPLPQRELVQMAGRAGRPGLDEQGTVTLLVHEKEVQQWQAKHRAAVTPVQSALADPLLLTERLLTAINGGYARTPSQLQRFLQQTLAAQQGLLPDVQRLLEAMETSGMVVQVGGTFQTTNLSAFAVSRYLQPETVQQFQRLLQLPLSFLDLLVVVCGCPDFTALLPVREPQVQQTVQCVAAVPALLLQSTRTLAAHVVLHQETLLKVVYTACCLYDWTLSGSLEETTETMCCGYQQDLLKTLKTAQRLLEALLELCTITDLPPRSAEKGSCSLPERLEALQKMVLYGLTQAEVTLLSVPGVSLPKAKQLIRSGINSAELLGQADAAAIATLSGFSLKTSTKAIRLAKAVAAQMPDFTESQTALLRQQSTETVRRLWIQAQTNWQRS